MPNTEKVSLVAGDGVAYTAWKSVSVKYNAESGERTFTLEAADEAPDFVSDAFKFAPGSVCKVYANANPFDPGLGTLVIDGFVKDLEIPLGADEHSLSVSGSTKGRDAHENSTKDAKNEWKPGKTVLDVAKAVDPNVTWSTDQALAPFKRYFRANLGESPFDIVRRAARAQGLYVHGKADGSIEITKHGVKRHAGAIVEGFNLHKGKVKFTDEKRFNKTTVKGQQPDGTKDDDVKVSESATDSGARAGREKIIYAPKPVTKEEAKKMAQKARDEARGQSVTISVTTVGWRDDGGTIWETGWNTFVQSGLWHVSRDMCIKSVELSQDEGSSGTLANLELVDPSNLGGKAQKSSGRQGSGGKDRSAPTYGEAAADDDLGGLS